MTLALLRHRVVRAVVALALTLSVLGWPSVAVATNCSPYRTWTTGDSLTVADLNTSFSTVGTTNMTPQCLGDYSADATQMNTRTDPNTSGSGSLATSGAGELERLRHVLFHVFNWSQWWTHYEDVNFRHRTIRNHFTTLTGFKQAFFTEAHLAASGTRLHFVSISTTEYVPGSIHPESMLLLIHVNTTVRFGVGIGGDVHVGSTLAIHAAGTATHTAIFRPPSTGTGIWWPAVTHVSVSSGTQEVVRFHQLGMFAGTDGTRDISSGQGNRFRHLHLTGGMRAAGLSIEAHTVAIANNAVGASANVEILAGDRSLYLVDCNDPDGCTIQLGTTGLEFGAQTRIYSITTNANTITMADVASVQHVASSFTMGTDDVISLQYVRNRSGAAIWIEHSRSNN